MLPFATKKYAYVQTQILPELKKNTQAGLGLLGTFSCLHDTGQVGGGEPSLKISAVTCHYFFIKFFPSPLPPPPPTPPLSSSLSADDRLPIRTSLSWPELFQVRVITKFTSSLGTTLQCNALWGSIK